MGAKIRIFKSTCGLLRIWAALTQNGLQNFQKAANPCCVFYRLEYYNWKKSMWWSKTGVSNWQPVDQMRHTQTTPTPALERQKTPSQYVPWRNRIWHPWSQEILSISFYSQFCLQSVNYWMGGYLLQLKKLVKDACLRLAQTQDTWRKEETQWSPEAQVYSHTYTHTHKPAAKHGRFPCSPSVLQHAVGNACFVVRSGNWGLSCLLGEKKRDDEWQWKRKENKRWPQLARFMKIKW